MTRSAAIESLETRRLLAFALNVNFQPASASVPAGYLADSGAAYGGRGNGFTYGWNQASTTATRDRNNSIAPDQRHDTLTHTQLYGSRTWELSVPNGQYSVRLVAGDASYFDSVYKLNVEGVLTVNGTPTSSNRFVEGSALVTVSDGKLTIANATGGSNNKLCFIDISSIEGPTKPSVSVAATDATAGEPGSNTGRYTITRSGGTSSALTVLYTVGGSAINGSDYNLLSGSVSIPAGAASATVTITPKDDTIVEGNENVLLTISSAAAYSVGTSSATVTIADNDSNPTPDGDWPTSWTTAEVGKRNRWESGAAVIDGKIWVFGGWYADSDLATQSYDLYDPATNKWTFKGTMPVPHSHSALAADDANNVIYFAGGLFGSYPGIPTNKVWKFNTLSNTWSELPSMPENHSSGGLALVNNELHYLGGTLDDRETNTGRHVVLNLNNTAAGWTVAPSLPSPRDHLGVIVAAGKIYAIGGEFGHDLGHQQQSLVHRYDPVAKTWQQLASMPTRKSHFEAALFVNPQGKIIVAGGQVDDYASTDEVVQYDPLTNTWDVIGKLPTKNQGGVVQQIGSKIYVHSGNPGTGPTKLTWIGALG
ncbi:MAG: kelch repeat-containing protein [Tepidisphaeraceae bacterium]